VEEEVERHRRGELWCAPKAAMTGVVLCADLPGCRHQIRRCNALFALLVLRLDGRIGQGEIANDAFRVLLQILSVALVEVCDAHDQLGPGHEPTPGIRRREVGAPGKGAPIWQTKYVERPPPMPVEHLNGLHV